MVRIFRSTAVALAVVATAVVAGSISAGAQKAAPQTSAQAATKNKVAFHVNENNPATMSLALNNVQNVIQHYKALKLPVDIEVVAYGPGLHMYRDASPVKQRIATMALENPGIKFSACGNTKANMEKAEGKDVTLISEAKIVPSGVIRLMELQKQGYAYIKP
jgi:hypothetical protein